MVKTSVFDYGKPSPKAIDSQRSAYTNAVILEPVRIMITYVRQTEIQKVAVQMSIRQFEDFLWTNLWSKIPCYLRRKKNYHTSVFFTIWFCYRLEILNHFRGAKHKAKKNLYYIYFMLCKPLSQVSQIFFVESSFDCKTLPSN